MGRKLLHFTVVLVVVFFIQTFWQAYRQYSWAYIPTVSSEGRSLRWTGRNLALAGNPTNRAGVSSGYFYEAVVRGLQRWRYASEKALVFDYWQGSDSGVFEPNSDYNGLSSIYFASAHRNGFQIVSSGVIATTEVWFDADSGEILETDVVLNDLYFNFSSNPTDTTGYGSGGGSGNTVFIENVITHELGHAFGLSHSGGLQSTMLYLESPEQAHLSCDDQAGIRTLYPGALTQQTSGVSGTVLDPSGNALFGGHVLMISRRRGTVMATAVTNRDGRFAIRSLEPGDYYLMVEPYYAGASALPDYYSGIHTRVCDGWNFGRSFLMNGEGPLLKTIQVSAGNVADIPAFRVECGPSGGAAVDGPYGGDSRSDAYTIYTGSDQVRGVVDRLRSSNDELYYELGPLSGRVELRALGYGLYSPVRLSLQLLDSNGSPVPGAQNYQPVYSGASGYKNYDAYVIADQLPSGTYYLKVSSEFLGVSRYPAGSINRDFVPFVMITGSVNEPAPVLSASTPFNAKCLQGEDFPPYQSPGGSPSRSEDEDEGGGLFGCGTVTSNSGGPPNISGMQLFNALLPFLFVFGFLQINRLSRWRRFASFLRLRSRVSTGNL